MNAYEELEGLQGIILEIMRTEKTVYRKDLTYLVRKWVRNISEEEVDRAYNRLRDMGKFAYTFHGEPLELSNA